MSALLRSQLIAALCGAVFLLHAPLAAAPGFPRASSWAGKPQYRSGEVLVKFKGAAVAQARAASIEAHGHAVLAQLGQGGWTHVKLGAGQSVADAIAAYQGDPSVEAAQPNYIYRATTAPNDPQYGQLWAFKNTGQNVTGATGTPGDDINIEKAWDHITDCSSVVVAVVDSGVNYNQQDLAPNMWNGGVSFPNHGNDFVDNDNDPMDLNGHGTHVAGIIGGAGNNGLGTNGVCWKATIMAVRVLDVSGSGSTSGIIQGLNFAVTNGAKVINMSLGGPGPVGGDPAFSSAITAAQNADVVVVVAAGNDGVNNDANGNATFPCNFTQPNLLCVAALDQNFALASFSNFGATSVDVGAPGTNILSSWAGAETTINDDFQTAPGSGVLDWTIPGTAGWAYGQRTVGGGPLDFLLNPSTFTGGTYTDSADMRVYKTFNLSGKNAATLNFVAQVNIQMGGTDSLNVNYKSTGGDPFVGGTNFPGANGSGSTGGLAFFSFDLSACLSATCSVGFQLVSDLTPAPTGSGAGIAFFSIDTLALNATTYKVENGTSMASPMVAGLAAMLRAFNPQFTFADTVNAIKNSGKSIPALSGKSTSGKAIDVMSALAFISAPTGVTAVVQ